VGYKSCVPRTPRFFAVNAWFSAPGALCAEGLSVQDFEDAADWRIRFDIERLRDALDDVAKCRGLIKRKLQC